MNKKIYKKYVNGTKRYYITIKKNTIFKTYKKEIKINMSNKEEERN